ncbi:hypothetical protein [Flavisolibacter ginsenosidimutans]|uniref:DUF748 domain-containing protein n=1 Tax=Flavisolibacter ginsenosidimutans TaxID=661481 RepID=A0A5B8ULQ7_9BACT|nr:hypothetical protein [Flavisolibacter ginsenosidimutans]QEC57508.1 hypothetical protein FSB75_16905 [Flavisolibacter ginsenosidimutans]
MLLVLVPGVVLIGAYLFLRFSLQSSVQKEEKKTGEVLPRVDSLGGKKLSVVDLRPLFVQRIQQVLKKSSNGLYTLSVGDLRIDVLASSVVLHGVKLLPDKAKQDSLKKLDKLPENVITASFDDLVIEGINLDDVLKSRKMDYTLIKLTKPVIVVHRTKPSPKGTQKKDFLQRFLKEMDRLSIKKILIEDGELTVYNDAKKSEPIQMKNISIRMNDLLIDSSMLQRKNRFLFAKEATVSFRDFVRPVSGGLYVLKMDAATATIPEQRVEISNFSYASPLSKAEFTKRQKWSEEMYGLSLPHVRLTNVDWWTLLNGEEITANNLILDGGKLSVYLDRTKPAHNSMGHFPNQLLIKLPLKIDVGKIAVRKLGAVYTEFNPATQQTGTVYMDDLTLNTSRLSNSKNSLPLVVKGSALFMHKVPLEARFKFDMQRARTGKFEAQIKTPGFDGRLINSFAMPLGMVRMDKGFLDGAEATISGDEQKASGDVLITYHDLKLSLLEKDKGKKGLDKKDVTSLLANILVIKNDNPKKGGEPRREQAEFIRKPTGGFFMLVWKTMLVGALKIIGAPTKYASK